MRKASYYETVLLAVLMYAGAAIAAPREQNENPVNPPTVAVSSDSTMVDPEIEEELEKYTEEAFGEWKEKINNISLDDEFNLEYEISKVKVIGILGLISGKDISYQKKTQGSIDTHTANIQACLDFNFLPDWASIDILDLKFERITNHKTNIDRLIEYKNNEIDIIYEKTQEGWKVKEDYRSKKEKKQKSKTLFESPYNDLFTEIDSMLSGNLSQARFFADTDTVYMDLRRREQNGFVIIEPISNVGIEGIETGYIAGIEKDNKVVPIEFLIKGTYRTLGIPYSIRCTLKTE